MTRKPKSKSQAIKSWDSADERDIIEALCFQTAPGAINTLLAYLWQKFTRGCPVALYAGWAQFIGVSVGCEISWPATTEQKCTITKLLQREVATGSTQHG